MKNIKLKDGHSIPALGLGTWEMRGETCRKAIAKAIKIGYRHLDTADMYQNHEAIAKGIKSAKVARKKLFITTKLWPNMLARERVHPAVKRFLTELDTDYIDLLLIHWPSRHVPIKETLKAMNKLKEEGLVNSIGVSNFTISHLEKVLETDYPVSVNQVEFHPNLNQTELKKFCDKHNINITAYSPLARGDALDINVIQDIADKYSATCAQVILSWHLTKGMSTIPKAANPKHMKENLEATKVKLKSDDLKKIDLIDANDRKVDPPFSPF